MLAAVLVQLINITSMGFLETVTDFLMFMAESAKGS